MTATSMRGRDSAPLPAGRDVFSTAEVAAHLGITTSLVRRFARTKGVGKPIGLAGWAFTRADVDALRERPRRGGRR